ncbi:MAG: carbohydrate kinase family protein [Planctomycetota bacterium]
MKPEIAGTGIATVDHLYRVSDVNALPDGQVLEYSVQGGGMAATAMAAASRLGASTAAVLCVGDDREGEEVLEGLQLMGVDTSLCRRKSGATPVILVLVDARTGERYFVPRRGESPLPGPEDIEWDLLGDANILLVDSCAREPGEILRRGQEMGLTTMVDMEFEDGEEADWIRAVDVYIGGGDRPEWRGTPEVAVEAARNMLNRGPHTSIMTMGSAGCAGVGPEGDFHIPPFDVEVVDTCGAGDVFRGAYAYALERGWRARHCAAFACAASALCTTRLGGRAGLSTADEVAALLLEDRRQGPWNELTG